MITLNFSNECNADYNYLKKKKKIKNNPVLHILKRKAFVSGNNS